MTTYTITIENYEDGLTASAVEDMIRDQLGGQDVDVTVEPE